MRIHEELGRWRAGGVRGVVIGGLPLVLLVALWKLAISDGGRHPASLAGVQTLVFVLCAILVALGSVRRTALIRPLAALVLAAALSAVWSVRPDSSVRELLLWSTYLAIIVVISSSLGSPTGARHLTDGLLLIGGWLSLIGLYLFWGTSGDPRLRWYSTFYAPNAFAAFLLLVLPLALTRCGLGRNRREAFDYGAVAVLLGVAFVLTYSRGAYLALILAGVAAVAVLRPGGWAAGRRIAMAAVVTAAAVTLLIRTPGTVITRSTAILDSGSSSIQDRLSFWRSAVAVFRDYPVTGSGPGTFAYVHGKYQGRYYAQDAHNLYLEVLAEMGALGAAALAAVLASLGTLWLRTLRKARGSEEYAVIAGVGVSLLAFLLHSAVEMTWHFPANPAVAFALAGVLAWHDRWSPSRGGDRQGRGPGRPVLRAAAMVLLVAGMGAVQVLRIADIEFARGRRSVAARSWSEASSRFARAATVNPLDPRVPSARAVTLQHLQRPDAAGALIRRSMALDRMNAYYPLQLAEVLLPGVRDDAAGREVEGLVQRALDLDPFHYPEGYRRLAGLYAGEGRMEDARAVYARAGAVYGSRQIAGDPILKFRLWPRVAALFSEWAAFAASRGTVDDGIGVLDELLRQDPAWQPAYRQIAALYLGQGRPLEAAHALVAGRAEQPDALALAPRPARLSAVFPRAYPR